MEICDLGLGFFYSQFQGAINTLADRWLNRQTVRQTDRQSRRARQAEYRDSNLLSAFVFCQKENGTFISDRIAILKALTIHSNASVASQTRRAKR